MQEPKFDCFTYPAVVVVCTIASELRVHRFDIYHTGAVVSAKPRGGYFLREGTVFFSLVFTIETGEVSNRCATVAEERTFIVGVLFTRGSILTPVAVFTSSKVAHGGWLKQVLSIKVWIAKTIRSKICCLSWFFCPDGGNDSLTRKMRCCCCALASSRMSQRALPLAS